MWFDDAHESGGRRVEYIRRLSVFKYFAQYFPVSPAGVDGVFAQHIC